MKRILLTSMTALILAASASGQAPPNGRKLATLGPDEYIVADESVLLGRGPAGCVADDFFVVTDARDVPAVGMPDKLATSADGTKAVLVCRGNLTFVQGMEIKPESIDATQFDNVTLYGLDGRTFGPFKKDDDFGEVWFLAESPDWVFTVGKVAYFNGAPLKPFAEEISKSRFWIDDAARYAWVEDEKLKFSDGASFPNPVMLNWVKRADKTTLCWISILPNRDVVGYSRGL
jgi:hypothetical protein